MNRRDRQRRRRKTHPARRIILFAGLLGLLAVLGAGGAAAIWVLTTADSAPDIQNLKPRVPGQVSQIFAAGGESLGYFSSDVVRRTLTDKEIPSTLKHATIAIEDRRFYQHGGVDYIGLLRAAARDLLDGGDALQGGSTLTMQLVGNVYLPSGIDRTHNLKYKIVQAKLATELEDKRSKNWILTQYLNDVPYGTIDGHNAIGVGAAAQMFFDKPVNKLDLAQMALLAGLPQAPSEYNPFLDPSLARWRRSQVLKAMHVNGYITRKQQRTANHSPLQVKANNLLEHLKQPYVTDYVEQQLVHDLGQRTVDRGGLKVYTTINLTDQAYAQEAIQENEGESGDPAASLVAIDPTNGNIVALANSSTYGTGKGETTFDYATQAQRQTGSAFKTFALMTLIKDYDGDPNQTYYESKYLPAGWLPGYKTYSVHTSEDSYQGDINITRATALSDNTVYAQLAVDLQESKVDVIAHAMGVTAKLCGNPSEVIGGLCQGVSSLQMSDAYATLANGGSHVPATIISKVVLPSGKVVNLGNPKHTQVFTQGQAYAGTQALESVLQYGTGTTASYGCPAAGKTGTTSNYTDAWFVGYTPELSTSVWVGYPNASTYMEDVNGLGPGYGGTLAAPIWKDFMEKAADGYCGDFATPTVPWTGTAYHGAHAVGGADYSYTSAYSTTAPVASTTSTDTTSTTTTDTSATDTSTTDTSTTDGSTAPAAAVTTSADTQATTTPVAPPAAGGGVAAGSSTTGGAGIG
jgi:penicillin-binding protein 1A